MFYHLQFFSSLNTDLGSKVSTNDARLSDARTPKDHNHDSRYYTEAEINNLLTNIKVKRKTITKSINANWAAFEANETGIPANSIILDVNIMRAPNYGYHFVVGHGVDSGGTLYAYLDGAITGSVSFYIHYVPFA